MSATRYGHSVSDIIGRRLFPNVDPSRRRTHLRFLTLAVALGLMVCGILGSLLWVMNRTRF
jgi:hypothetical protein